MIFRSLRAKLLAIYLTIVVLFIGCLGGVLTMSYRKNLTQMREDRVKECAKQIADMYADGSLTVLDLEAGQTIPVLMTTAKDFDASIQIANTSSKRLFYNMDAEQLTVYEKDELISDEIFKTVFVDGKTYIKSDYYNESMGKDVITVAEPIMYLNSKDIWAVLIIHSSLDTVNQAYSRIMATLWVPAVLVVLFGLVCILVLTSGIVSRVKKLNNLTQDIAKGKFDNKVTIKSHDEIGQLAEAFNKMADDLKIADASKRDFVSNAAHELRSPMTSINGFVEGMLDGTIPKEKHKMYLEIVSSEVKRLTKLVKTMLDLSRIESGRDKITVSKIDINELIRHVVIRLSGKIEEKGIQPEIEISDDQLFVMADGDKIEQVLQNLIDNAIKFTDKDKTIVIATEVTGDKVKIIVRDEGAGISEEDLKFIWDRFYTVDKVRSANKSGTGLGLSIVKSIIEQHNETITVTSKVNVGTEFVFTLQYAGE
jgi:signal transduction histidine kinase